MKIINVSLKNENGTELYNTNYVLPAKSAVRSLREFDKTVTDLANGGEGKPVNDIAAIANDKYRANFRQDFDSHMWELIKYKGKFYIKATEAE